MGNAIQQNKMGSVPVPKLLLSMGAPMMLSMLGQALYNMVDTFFVSWIPDTAEVVQMGDKAINALTLAYPIQMLMIALMVGIGIATNTMLAQSLGQKDRERASRVAGNAMMISLCFFVVVFLFGLFGARAFIASQTRDAVVVELGTTYLRIVTLLSFGTIGYMCLEKVVMGCGNTKATMVGQLSGAITNIILDPILIFGLLGLPALGVAGAAWATVIGQFVSFFVIAFINFGKNKEINSGLKYLRPHKEILKTIFTISFPATVMQVLTPVMSYGMNLILGTMSSFAVTAYGVYYKLQYFVYMAAYGLNNASISITAYNLGAKDKERISLSIRYAVGYVLIIMTVGVVLLQLLARPLVGLFSIAEESTNLCIWAVHIASLGFFFGGANIMLSGICQALGNGIYSLIVSLLRYVVIALPLAYVFTLTAWGGTLVWAALPIAEAAACAVAALLTRKLYKTQVAVL
ncbi:MAG: MATE family efflux transporter [Oscillospiraceae bacterium]